MLGPAVPNLDEQRIAARRKAGKSHVVIYDGPTTPEAAGYRRREALGGAGFKKFGHPGKKTKQRFRAPPVPLYFGKLLLTVTI